MGTDEAVATELGGAAAGQPVPFKVLHRLLGLDYDKSLHDLTGTQQQFAATFPADGTINNFDNGAETVSLLPAWLDLFVQAAVEVGDEVTASATDDARKEAVYFHVAPCAKTQEKGCLTAAAEDRSLFNGQHLAGKGDPEFAQVLLASIRAAGVEVAALGSSNETQSFPGTLG